MACRGKRSVDNAFPAARSAILVLGAVAFVAANRALAQQPAGQQLAPAAETTGQAPPSSQDRAALEKAFARMLSRATLEGSFTSTGAGRDPTKLSREKYTLGQVQKLAGNLWLIPARIQYGEHDVTLPVTVPIRWAGDTPVLVVDNVPLPGFGTVSARVMFFADHYAGYWKHGERGGHLFGIIRRGENADGADAVPADAASRSNSQSAGNETTK
jgi:hypothetical protein